MDGGWPYYHVTYRFFWCIPVPLAILSDGHAIKYRQPPPPVWLSERTYVPGFFFLAFYWVECCGGTLLLLSSARRGQRQTAIPAGGYAGSNSSVRISAGLLLDFTSIVVIFRVAFCCCRNESEVRKCELRVGNIRWKIDKQRQCRTGKNEGRYRDEEWGTSPVTAACSRRPVRWKAKARTNGGSLRCLILTYIEFSRHSP